MNLKVPTMAELVAAGETPDVLFWVGCAGSFDERAKKITKSFEEGIDLAVDSLERVLVKRKEKLRTI